MEELITFETVFGNKVSIPKSKCYKYVDKLSAKSKRYFVEHFSFDGPCYKKEISELEYNDMFCKPIS